VFARLAVRSGAPTEGENMSITFTITRAEAAEISQEMRMTGPDRSTINGPHSSREVDDLIDRLRLERAVRLDAEATA